MSVEDRYLIGDTIKATWVNSGVTPSSISVGLIDGAELLVSSSTMTSSGDGHYYQPVTLPNTPGRYVLEFLATIDAYPYKRRRQIWARTEDVD